MLQGNIDLNCFLHFGYHMSFRLLRNWHIISCRFVTQMQAKKTLRCLKGVKRLHIIGQTNPVNKQTAATLNYIQSWNKLQAEIRNRRAFMVTEGRNRKKKQENQMKLEAKLQNLQVNFS